MATLADAFEESSVWEGHWRGFVAEMCFYCATQMFLWATVPWLILCACLL